MRSGIKLERVVIGDGQRVYVVAEVSANHGQNYNRAAAMIRRAKACGADAVKFQTYTPDSLTIDSRRKYFRIKHPQWGGQTLHELYEKAYTPWHWFAKLKKVADAEGITFLSTALDRAAVDLLEELDVPAHKIASFELVDLGLIEYAAATGKPVILSTGMATVPEITEAVRTARKAGARDIILLKCVSAYPAGPQEMNLRTIPDMGERFGCPVGLSDHTLGIGVSVAAVSLGAVMIEKHFTLSRKIQTLDGFFSIEPAEMKELVDGIRVAEQAMGKVSYEISKSQKASRVFRRSLFAVEEIRKGDCFTPENVRSIRPADGLKPKHLGRILGRKARRRIARGTPLTWDMIR